MVSRLEEKVSRAEQLIELQKTIALLQIPTEHIKRLIAIILKPSTPVLSPKALEQAHKIVSIRSKCKFEIKSLDAVIAHLFGPKIPVLSDDTLITLEKLVIIRGETADLGISPEAADEAITDFMKVNEMLSEPLPTL